MTPWGSGETDLLAHVQRLMLDISPDLYDTRGIRYQGDPTAAYQGDADPTQPQAIRRAFGWSNEPGPWVPSLAGRPPTVLEVDEDHEENVDIIAASPVPPNAVFRTAYALRVVDIENPRSYVISDVVEVQGDGEGQVTYRL
jgi:hypothetical protein